MHRQIVLGGINEPTKRESRIQLMSGAANKLPPPWFKLYFLVYEIVSWMEEMLHGTVSSPLFMSLC